MEKDFICDAVTMDMLISAVADTFLASKEDISIKLDAIILLICVVVKYTEDYMHNQSVYEKIFEKQDEIESADHQIIFSNINSISLRIGLHFLFISMSIDVYGDILELLPYVLRIITI